MTGKALIGWLVAGVLASISIDAGAQPAGGAAPKSLGDTIVPPPPMYKATAATVNVDEHLGAKLPADAKFRTLDGTIVTLASVLGAGNQPTILTFNYASCPLLCSMQLNGLSAAIPDAAKAGPPNNVAIVLGEHYRIVTISLEPYESLEKLSRMRDKYIERLPEPMRASARKGWTFLAAATPGDGETIRQIADVVGFKYTYIAERAEWAHPAAFIFLSTAGAVTRYVFGFELEPEMLRESVYKAGIAEPATAAGFMHTCYFYDPDASNHSRAGVMALRIGAAGFVALLLSGLGVLHLVRKHSRRPEVS